MGVADRTFPAKTLMQLAEEWRKADKLENAATAAAIKAEAALRAALSKATGIPRDDFDVDQAYRLLTLKQ